jgi:hypothetical protein
MRVTSSTRVTPYIPNAPRASSMTASVIVV